MQVRILKDAQTDKHSGNLEFLMNKLKDEVSGYDTKNEILVVPGDIGPVVDSQGYVVENVVTFLKFLKEHWNNIIMIAGNNEYHGIEDPISLEVTDKALNKICKEVGITFLQKGMTKIGDYYVLGCTLWRYISRKEWKELDPCDRKIFVNMNFYRLAYADHLEWLNESLEYVRSQGGKAIVITHYPPECSVKYPLFSVDRSNCNHIEKFIKHHQDCIKIWISHLQIDCQSC